MRGVLLKVHSFVDEKHSKLRVKEDHAEADKNLVIVSILDTV